MAYSMEAWRSSMFVNTPRNADGRRPVWRPSRPGRCGARRESATAVGGRKPEPQISPKDLPIIHLQRTEVKRSTHRARVPCKA